jgi:hypothetical protein
MICTQCNKVEARHPGSTCGLKCATEWDNQVNAKSRRKIPNDSYETIMVRFNAHVAAVKGGKNG